MVVASGEAAQENTLKYTKAVLDMYQSAYRAMSPPLNPFEFIQPPTAPTAQPSPADSAGRTVRPKKDEAGEVDELKQRIKELESLVSGMGARRPERKRKGKPPGRR